MRYVAVDSFNVLDIIINLIITVIILFKQSHLYTELFNDLSDLNLYEKINMMAYQ